MLLATLLLTALTAPTPAAEQTTLVRPPFGHCLGITKVTAFHMFLHFGGLTRFDEPAGMDAVKLRVKDDPSNAGDDDELTVFGLNSGRSELIFNTSLYRAELYGSEGTGPGRFRRPTDVAADQRGNVFVTDTGNHRVVRLVYEADTLRYVRSLGSKGEGERQFLSPSGLALGASGKLYVADTGNDRIVVMSGTGEDFATIGGAGGVLDEPFGIDVAERDERWIAGRRAFVVVSDRGGTRLTTLAHDGTVLATVGSESLPVPGASFGHLAIDYYGSVYAVDQTLGAIHKLDADLRYVTTFGLSENGRAVFDEPRGITIWRRFGQVFVSERAGAQYFWIGTDIENAGVQPQPASQDDVLDISYTLTEVARVTIEILDDRDKVLATIASNRRRGIGPALERWRGLRQDGNDRSGQSGAAGNLTPGRYTLRISARPTYSSGEYFEAVATVPLEIAAPGR